MEEVMDMDTIDADLIRSSITGPAATTIFTTAVFNWKHGVMLVIFGIGIFLCIIACIAAFIWNYSRNK
ncbi:hypothetical protein DICVIV_01336 [Dictyocaulus viviparus]|uniref:Uncharacterized protein n=1 Tax=Dictyocaulus viviparus TaxID=29172 RepID=A0A0D8Y6Y1_DICVI|nr:hypothetical protein DICVIV_01336 [Dictyocaulus viviparus]